jgi:hypothetical protein
MRASRRPRSPRSPCSGSRASIYTLPVDADERQERQEQLSERMLEFLGEYVDTWDSTEGGIVTAFYCTLEVATPDGEKALVEFHSKMPVHVAQGMLFNALHDPRWWADD